MLRTEFGAFDDADGGGVADGVGCQLWMVVVEMMKTTAAHQRQLEVEACQLQQK